MIAESASFCLAGASHAGAGCFLRRIVVCLVGLPECEPGRVRKDEDVTNPAESGRDAVREDGHCKTIASQSLHTSTSTSGHPSRAVCLQQIFAIDVVVFLSNGTRASTNGDQPSINSARNIIAPDFDSSEHRTGRTQHRTAAKAKGQVPAAPPPEPSAAFPATQTASLTQPRPRAPPTTRPPRSSEQPLDVARILLHPPVASEPALPLQSLRRHVNPAIA
ncbi:hypothetical protein J1614_005414 [Plenodomus biglobosus]|nr:hypothetical protein J1614_005414 [Plenodomus biglobosus]